MTQAKGRSAGLLTYQEAAEALGVSLSTLKRRVFDGSLPVVEVSAQIRRIHPDDLAAFVARRRSA